MVDFPASYVGLQECNHGSVEKTSTTKLNERKLILEKNHPFSTELWCWEEE